MASIYPPAYLDRYLFFTFDSSKQFHQLHPTTFVIEIAQRKRTSQRKYSISTSLHSFKSLELRYSNSFVNCYSYRAFHGQAGGVLREVLNRDNRIFGLPFDRIDILDILLMSELVGVSKPVFLSSCIQSKETTFRRPFLATGYGYRQSVMLIGSILIAPFSPLPFLHTVLLQ